MRVGLGLLLGAVVGIGGGNVGFSLSLHASEQLQVVHH